MNPGNRRDTSNNNNRRAEAIAAMPIAGIVVGVSLLPVRTIRHRQQLPFSFSAAES